MEKSNFIELNGDLIRCSNIVKVSKIEYGKEGNVENFYSSFEQFESNFQAVHTEVNWSNNVYKSNLKSQYDISEEEYYEIDKRIKLSNDGYYEFKKVYEERKTNYETNCYADFDLCLDNSEETINISECGESCKGCNTLPSFCEKSKELYERVKNQRNIIKKTLSEKQTGKVICWSCGATIKGSDCEYCRN